MRYIVPLNLFSAAERRRRKHLFVPRLFRSVGAAYGAMGITICNTELPILRIIKIYLIHLC